MQTDKSDLETTVSELLLYPNFLLQNSVRQIQYSKFSIQEVHT